jgi:tetraacyldisaccharide 4'-kinase
VAAERRHGDHHRFTASDLADAFDGARRAGCDLVVTTEKDAVRLPPGAVADRPLAVLRIRSEILRGAPSLDAALDAALRSGAEGAPAWKP